MQKAKLVEQDPQNGLTGKKRNTYSFFNISVLLGLFTFKGLLLLFGLLIYQRYLLVQKTKEKEAHEIINQTKDKLQKTLEQSITATKILSFIIDRNGQVNNFDSVAAQILETANGIDALQLVPGGIIQYVYPLKGNDHVIGYNLLKDTTRNKEAFKAIEKKEMFFAGPFELRQGGIGVVGRLPVYRNNSFWGFSAIVIKMATLFKAAGIDSGEVDGNHFQLSKVNPVTNKTEYFLPVQKARSNTHVVSVDVPNGEWKLSLTVTTPSKGIDDITLLAIFGFILSVIGGVFVYRLMNRPRLLNQLVLNRTRELKTSENNYRSLIERVSDAFISLDNDWNYTYVNKKAGELLATNPGKLVGKNIWAEFPEAVDKPYYHAYQSAMQRQQYQFYEEFYPHLNKWFENHIYPSKDGLTIFFKDVTEIKNVSQALKENEEKYRSLIEQASDGIVITNLEGFILEVNKSIADLSGYSIEEMLGKHLYDFLPDDAAEINPLKFNELMEGKSLLYERKLLKKDGTQVDIEVNSKMASSQTLIGFIRDITERKKHESALQYQASLLQNVSDAITSFDSDRCIVSWNKACEELYGFTAAEAIGKRVPQLVKFKFPGSSIEAVFKQLFSTGYWRGEFNFIHPKTNENVYLLSNLNVLKNDSGEVTGFILTSKNITDRVKADEVIRISNERFELIAQSTNDAVWDHNFLLNETWGNYKLYNLYGVEPGNQTINFEMFLERIHPDEREGIVNRMKAAIDRKDNSIAEEFRFKTVNNEYRFFYDRAYITYDAAGNPLRILGAMQDITDSEKAKTDILESEEKFSKSFHSSLLGLALYDSGFYIIDANDMYIQILGSSREKLVGKHSDVAGMMSMTDPVKRADIDAELEKLMTSTGKLSNYEIEIIKSNNLQATIQVSMEPLKLNGKDFWLTSAIDITEKKKAEKALQESEERYRALVDNAPEALVVLDVTKQKFVSVSESATKLFKMTREALLEIGPVGVSPQYQPDGRLSAEAAEKYLQKAIAGEKVVFEWMHCDKEGNQIPCEIWLVRLPSDNEILLRGSIIDITERKNAAEELFKSEQKYKLLFYNNPLPMWMTTQPGLDIIDVNDAAIKQYGYSRKEFLKLNTRMLRPAEDVESFLSEVEKMQPDMINIRNWRHKKKDGTIIQVESYSHEIVYEGKRAWLSLSHDVTDRYEAREQLQKSYEDIRQLAINLQSIREDERTSIAREIHDELGQQLTGLKMDLHWLSRKINSTDTEITGKMQESMELINATITSVRKISTDLRPSILDDLGLISALEWQGEEFEKRSGTHVEFINKAGDITVQPDAATGIFRIYQELLTNIARHANASEVKALLYKDSSRLYFSITDNGVGFNLETINNKKTLGLLGIKERTLILGGTYEFKSKPGEGSVTTISIPINLVTSSV